MSAEARLEALRAALLEADRAELGDLRRELDRLAAEVDKREVSAETLWPMLAPAVNLAKAERRDALVSALNDIVAEAVKHSIRADRDAFAESISPVIGVSIRKAIASAMKGLNQTINQAVEYSLSPKGVRLRLQAARSGVPFAQLVMRETLPYVLEELFLIQNQTGLLAAHASNGDGAKVDSDGIAAMLTAIRDFVKDSFNVGDGQLEEVEIGGRVVWVIPGAHYSFAAVVHGTPPVQLRDELEQLLVSLADTHHKLLSEFDGNRELVSVVAAEMQATVDASLSSDVPAEEDDAKPKSRWRIWLALLVAFSLSGYWGFRSWEQRQEIAAAKSQLTSRADVLVTQWQFSDGKLQAAGLYDPALGELLVDEYLSGGWAKSARWEFLPYRSALPAVLVAEKRAQWAVPQNVSLVNEGGVWRVLGVAPIAWAMNMRSLAGAGLPVPDMTGVSVSENDVLTWVEARLPTGLRAELSASVLSLAGEVAFEQEESLLSLLRVWRDDALLGIAEVELSGLKRQVAEKAENIAAAIAARRLGFATGVVMTPAGWADMEAMAADLNGWVASGFPRQGLMLTLRHSGVSVSKKRASKLRDLLMQRGVPARFIAIAAQEALVNENGALDYVPFEFTYSKFGMLNLGS